MCIFLFLCFLDRAQVALSHNRINAQIHACAHRSSNIHTQPTQFRTHLPTHAYLYTSKLDSLSMWPGFRSVLFLFLYFLSYFIILQKLNSLMASLAETFSGYNSLSRFFTVFEPQMKSVYKKKKRGHIIIRKPEGSQRGKLTLAQHCVTQP